MDQKGHIADQKGLRTYEKGQKSFVPKTPVYLMLSLPMMNCPAVFKKDVPLPVSSCLGGFFQKCFCQNQAQNLVLTDALNVHYCHFFVFIFVFVFVIVFIIVFVFHNVLWHY